MSQFYVHQVVVHRRSKHLYTILATPEWGAKFEDSTGGWTPAYLYEPVSPPDEHAGPYMRSKEEFERKFAPMEVYP